MILAEGVLRPVVQLEFVLVGPRIHGGILLVTEHNPAGLTFSCRPPALTTLRFLLVALQFPPAAGQACFYVSPIPQIIECMGSRDLTIQ